MVAPVEGLRPGVTPFVNQHSVSDNPGAGDESSYGYLQTYSTVSRLR